MFCANNGSSEIDLVFLMAQSARPSLPPLGWIRAFEAAARRLNFTAAAGELGLTQAAVSQQIKLLEAQLGTQLFRRLRRGVELTPVGAAYLPHVQAAFRSLSSSTAELFGRRSAATVAIRSPISFAALWLAPRLRGFTADLPNVRLDISTIHVPADYSAAGPRLDVRFGAGPFAGRTALRLTSERLVPVAAPGPARGPHDADARWRESPLLSVSGAREMWPDWFALAGMPPPAQPPHRFDSFIVALQAARAGGGVLLASLPMADRAIEAGELVRLSLLELHSDAGHFITFPSGSVLDPHEQAAVDWLLRQASLQTIER
jgi:DNA-binding transcriptional LysR family regulator